MVDKCFSLWSLFIPITSVVLIPEIKGTLPSYFLAILSLFIGFKYRKQYSFGLLFKIIYVIITMLIISQLCVLLCGEFLPDLILVDKNDSSTVAFRTTILTQSLYLIPGILTFLFTFSFYKISWDKWILIGGMILALYGLYEWGYLLITGENGDFLSNRWFGDDQTSMNGSLFQKIQLGGLVVQRLKSLVGEPSMYAYTMLAYWIYALHIGRKKLAAFYLITLILSTSTTAFMGILLYIAYRIFKYREIKTFIYMIAIVLLCLMFFYDVVYEFIDNMIVAKVYMENTSGDERGSNFIEAILVFINSPLPIELFGWGWGTIRSTDFFSTILINGGIVGFILWTFAVLYPCKGKVISYKMDGLKAILLIEYLVMMVSVSEFSYLFYWMYLGISYNYVNSYYRQCKDIQF